MSAPSSSSVSNPLDLFRRNARTTNIIVEDVLPVERQIERSERWLFNDSLDINFGIKGNNKDVHIRRAYRRIKSSALFRKQPRSEVSLEDIHSKAQLLPPPKKYILIEESRLAGLRRVEEILADERRLLEEQCSLLAGTADLSSDSSLDPAVPTPAAKIAIDKMYESKIQLVEGKMKNLERRFREYCKKNEELERGQRPSAAQGIAQLVPLEKRMLRYKFAKEASLASRVQQEWDWMSYEDDRSYLCSLLSDLVRRRRDYNTYYVLATRYGEYTAEEFYDDRYPGGRYYNTATSAALVIQTEWALYWAVEGARRVSMASKIQRQFRFWWAFKKYHPLIIFRMRFGKRSYYAFCWSRWVSYNRMIRMCKEAIAYALQNPYYRLCFDSWRTLHRETKARNQETLRLNLMKMMKAGLYKCFGVWKDIIVVKKQRILTLRRKFKNPHFEKWIRFTEYSKGYKRMERAAVVLQKYHRMFKALRKYRTFLRGKRVFRSLCVLKQKRAAYTEENIGSWLPTEAERAHTAASLAAKKGLLAKHVRLARAEGEGSTIVLKFLESRDGKRQLKSMGASVIKMHYSADPTLLEQIGGRSDVLHLAKTVLLRRCVVACRECEAHDFDAKNPPPLRCPDPACGAMLLSTGGFQSHVTFTETHKDKDAALLNRLSIALRDPVLNRLLQEYLQEQKQVVLGYCLELYNEIERWRQHESSSAEYYSRGRSIYETYVPRRAKRECQLGEASYADVQALRTVFASQAVAHVYFKKVAGGRSTLRRLLGLKAKEHNEWTDELLLRPSRFYRLQWLAMLKIYEHLATHAETFAGSAAHADIVARENALVKAGTRKTKQDFKLYFYNTCLAWASALKRRTAAIDTLGSAAADRVFSLLVEDLAARAADVCIDKKLFYLFDGEQRRHEKAKAMSADAVFWVRDIVAEDLYATVLRTMLKAMNENKAQRDQLLVLAGLRERKIKKAKTISMKVAKTEALGMLDSLF